jgi:hypothetical protein
LIHDPQTPVRYQTGKLGVALDIVLEAEALSVMKEVVSRSGIYTVLPSYAVSQEVKAQTLSISRIVNEAQAPRAMIHKAI